MKIIITFTEEMLGTKPSKLEIYEKFIASKAPKPELTADELEAAEANEAVAEEKEKEPGFTIFHKKNGVPFIYNYQIKGFFKDAAAAINQCDKEFRGGVEKLTAYKTKIDRLIFVSPRTIPIILPEGTIMGTCGRPLLGQTAQGPRVSIAVSETVPDGSTITFDLKILSKALERYIQVWLDYGADRGIGQWRNSGKGSFTWAQIDG